MTATSSSDRIQAAREALRTYDALCEEPDNDPGFHDRIDALVEASDALRALIEPPATEEGPKEIAERIVREWMDAEIANNPASTAPFDATKDLDTLLTKAVVAGIQAAWESWEPDYEESEDRA